jgi:hypothetical protein
MNKAISNTSPLLYLYRVGNIDWLPKLFDEIWISEPVKDELQTGKIKGYDVPNPSDYAWLLAALRSQSPHRPCIAAFACHHRTALVSAAHLLVTGIASVYLGLVVLVIGGALVFGVFPTYFSTFSSVAAEFILRA